MSALDDFLMASPYVRFLGMQARLEDGVVTGVLPFARHLDGPHGNPIRWDVETQPVAQHRAFEEAGHAVASL